MGVREKGSVTYGDRIAIPDTFAPDVAFLAGFRIAAYDGVVRVDGLEPQGILVRDESSYLPLAAVYARDADELERIAQRIETTLRNDADFGIIPLTRDGIIATQVRLTPLQSVQLRRELIRGEAGTDLRQLDRLLGLLREQGYAGVRLTAGFDAAVPADASLYLVGELGSERFRYTVQRRIKGGRRSCFLRTTMPLDLLVENTKGAPYIVENIPSQALADTRDLRVLLTRQYRQVRELIRNGRLSHYPLL